MKTNIQLWNTIDDVPKLTIDWAQLLSGYSLNLIEIKDLIETYEMWLDQYGNTSYDFLENLSYIT